MIRCILLISFMTFAMCGFGQELPADSCFIENITTIEIPSGEIETEVTDAENVGADLNVIKSESVKFDYKQTKYWGRYTALRAAGWSCFGVGAGFLVGGYAFLFASTTTTNFQWANAAGIMGGIMFFSSPILIVSSIPLIACAYYNRYKAKHLKLDVGVSYLPSDRFQMQKHSTPALSLALNF